MMMTITIGFCRPIIDIDSYHITLTTNQSEWTQNGKCFVVGQNKLHETETDDEQVEAVPAVLEVPEQTERHDLQRSFRSEYSRVHLITEQLSDFASNSMKQWMWF